MNISAVGFNMSTRFNTAKVAMGADKERKGWWGSGILSGDWWKKRQKSRPSGSSARLKPRKPSQNTFKPSGKDESAEKVNGYSQVLDGWDPSQSALSIVYGDREVHKALPKDRRVIIIGRSEKPADYTARDPSAVHETRINGVTINGPEISRNHFSIFPFENGYLAVNGSPASDKALLGQTIFSERLKRHIRVPTYPELTLKYKGPEPPKHGDLENTEHWQEMESGAECLVNPENHTLRIKLAKAIIVDNQKQITKPSDIYTLKCEAPPNPNS